MRPDVESVESLQVLGAHALGEDEKLVKVTAKVAVASPTWKVAILDGLAGVNVSVKVALLQGSTVIVSDYELLPQLQVP